MCMLRVVLVLCRVRMRFPQIYVYRAGWEKGVVHSTGVETTENQTAGLIRGCQMKRKQMRLNRLALARKQSSTAPNADDVSA